jgi:L-2-amino-thiazoline-4-carboxylic acid hydrolase
MPDNDEVAINHLQRRKIEGRVFISFIETLRQKLGENGMREIVDATIRQLAAEDGARWAETRSIDSLRRVAQDVWAGGGSFDIRVIRQSDDQRDFDVTRCAYAEFYKALGLADIGHRVHCNRDHTIIEGFSSDLALSRSQTLMEGAGCCDFRYRRKS